MLFSEGLTLKACTPAHTRGSQLPRPHTHALVPAHQSHRWWEVDRRLLREQVMTLRNRGNSIAAPQRIVQIMQRRISPFMHVTLENKASCRSAKRARVEAISLFVKSPLCPRELSWAWGRHKGCRANVCWNLVQSDVGKGSYWPRTKFLTHEHLPKSDRWATLVLYITRQQTHSEIWTYYIYWDTKRIKLRMLNHLKRQTPQQMGLFAVKSKPLYILLM